MSDQKCETIGEFVALIEKTEIPEGKKWFKEFVAEVPKGAWLPFCQRAITVEAVEQMAMGVSFRISHQLKNWHYIMKRPWKELAEKGHAFLREIHKKAADIGLEADLIRIDWVLEPEMARGIQH